MKINSKRLQKFFLLLTLSTGLILAKDFTDNMGYTYSTDKKIDAGYTEFVQVRGESVALMDDMNSSTSITILPNKTYVQLVDRDGDWCFVRVPDSGEGYLEGWIKDNKIKKEKDGSLTIFYGKTLLLIEDIIQKRPSWVLSDSTALKSLPKDNARNLGDIFFSTKIFIQQEITDYFQVKVYDEYDRKYLDGWVLKKDVTENEKLLSGQEEVIATTDNSPDQAAANLKILELKARLEAIEKEKKEKENAELMAASANKEIQFKAIKIKKHNEDIAVLNTAIEEYRKEISNENSNITEFKQEIASSQALIQEREQLITGLHQQRIEADKQKEEELLAAKNKEIEQQKLKENIDSYSKEMEILSKNQQSSNNEIKNISDELTELNTLLDKLNSDLDEKRNLLNQSIAKLEELNKKSVEKKIAEQLALENQKTAKEEIERRLNNAKEQKAELLSELENNKKELASGNKELLTYKTENSNQLLTLKNLKETLAKTEKELLATREKEKLQQKEFSKTAAEINSRMAKIRTELESKKQSVAAAQTEQEQLIAELNTFKAKVEQKKDELNKLNNDLNGLKTQKLTSIAEAANQAKEREKLRLEQIEQIKNQISALKNDAAKVTKEINELKSKVASENSDFKINEKKLAANSSQLTGLITLLAESSKKKEAADRKIAAQKAIETEKQKAIEAKIAEKAISLEMLKANLELKDSEIESIRTGIKSEKSSREQFENSIAEKKLIIKDQEIIIASLKQQVMSGQKGKIESQNKLKSDLANINNSLKKIETEISAAKKNVADENKLSVQLKNRMSDLNQRLQTAEAKIIELKNKKIEVLASKETKETDKKAALLNGQLKELKNRLSTADNQLFAAKDEINELKIQIKKWETDILDKNHEQELAQADIQNAKSKKGTASKEQDALKAQLAELEAAQANLNDSGTKARVLKKSRKRTGFKKSTDASGDEPEYDEPANAWNREPYNIELMIKDKGSTVTNLYKKYKTQDNLLAGQFTLKFDLTADGKTKKVRITDATWSNATVGTDLVKEIEKKVRGWTFPQDNHPDPTQRQDKPISIPYIF